MTNIISRHLVWCTPLGECIYFISLGRGEDGHRWEACVYDKYNIKAPCLVYSFG